MLAPASSRAKEPSTRRRPALRVGLSLAIGAPLLVGLGCYGVAPPAEPALEEMHAHFQAATDARRAAIFGDLVGLRTAAHTIYQRGSVSGITEEQSVHLFDLRQKAQEMEARSSTRATVAALPGLLTECAGCHEAAGVDLTPRFALRNPPDPSVLQDPHGQGLGWALNRLWEGVLGPSVAAWDAGAEALTRPPALPQRAAERSPSAAELGRQELMVLGGRAKAASDPAVRAEVLGDVLEACRSCHVSAAFGAAEIVSLDVRSTLSGRSR